MLEVGRRRGGARCWRAGRLGLIQRVALDTRDVGKVLAGSAVEIISTPFDICGPREADVGGSRSTSRSHPAPCRSRSPCCYKRIVIRWRQNRRPAPKPCRNTRRGRWCSPLPAMTTSNGYGGEDPDRHSRPPRLRKGGRRPPPDPRRDGGRRRQRTCRQVEALADDEDNAHTASTESSTTTDAEAVAALPDTGAHPRNLRPRRRLARFPSGTKGAQ